MSKVSIVKCGSYDSGEVAEAVSRAVDLLGGIEKFLRRDDNVLIKPNLLSAKKPEEAVCTHPEIVRAVTRLVKKVGARISIGDSPGNFFTIKDVDHVYEETGIKRIADEEGVELARFDKSRVINGYPIAEAALNASFIISLPKLKTHSLTVMTGAIKNTFGMIPGFFKMECHKNKPLPKDFVKVLLDVFEIAKPHLSIMDAVVGMEGDGPAAGIVRKIGLVMSSTDAVSLDAVISALVGVPLYKDILINEARRRGSGEANISNIEIVGEGIEGVKVKDFKLPKASLNLLPGFLADIIKRLIQFRPVIKEELCKKCEVCKNSCPADAIIVNKEQSRIDDSLCVRCFCCNEVCPYNAIYIERNFITSLFWRD